MFIKGSPMQLPPGGHPAIIEFWASWCGPCRAAFPHLSELARRHKADGLVVGVNIEGDAPLVHRVVTESGTKMDYNVAIDVGQQASSKLMAAAGLSGIPCAFVVDARGTIRHYGHPMEPKFAEIVAQVCKESGGGAAKSQPPPTPTPPSAPRPAPISLDGRSREELLQAPVRELKAVLESWSVPFDDLNEKRELVDRILERCHS